MEIKFNYILREVINVAPRKNPILILQRVENDTIKIIKPIAKQFLEKKIKINRKVIMSLLFISVQSLSRVSLRPHESQHARPPYPSLSPGVHSNSHPSSQ